VTTLTLPQVDDRRPGPRPPREPHAAPRVVLIGNPNAGKTALFNAMTGLRAKTANFPGTTVEHRHGELRLDPAAGGETPPARLIDLPGLYSLDAATAEERIARAVLHGEPPANRPPDLCVLVVDSTNLERNLFLAGQVLELGLPTVVALNLTDAARAEGIRIDHERLAAKLGCAVVPVSARTREGLDGLRRVISEQVAIERVLDPVPHAGCSCTSGCRSCPFADRYDWAEGIAREVEAGGHEAHGRTTERIDRVLTHPWVGVAAFFAIMAGVFYLIFSLAGVPMGLIEQGFEVVAGAAAALLPGGGVSPWLRMPLVAVGTAAVLLAALRYSRLPWRWWSIATVAAAGAGAALIPAGDFESLVVDGVIGGVGGVLVFLPQIAILFFCITLLEDSGYLARAAFVMEKLMRRVGLPGKAFVPMLSAHACAIPGIMATRVIESKRDRLVTILVLPLMTCSARLPVYAMITALLFGDEPLNAAMLFLAAYALGIAAALGSAWVFKKTLLKGETDPLVIELPSYRLPSLRNAVLTTWDRAAVFIRKAGTIILLISVGLWVLASYPKMPADALPAAAAAEAATLGAEAEALAAAGDVEATEAAATEAETLVAQHELAYSAAGRVGHALEPVFAPLGYNWQINVGVVSSFAAREVVVSTLAIIYGVGEDDGPGMVEAIRAQKNPDGTPVFTVATALSLLVFFVLAMQCLPTQAVTKRETGSWGWAMLQLGYMTALAYTAALVTYQAASAMGFGV